MKGFVVYEVSVRIGYRPELYEELEYSRTVTGIAYLWWELEFEVCSVKVKRRQYRPDEKEDKHLSVEIFKQISCLAWIVDISPPVLFVLLGILKINIDISILNFNPFIDSSIPDHLNSFSKQIQTNNI